MNVTQPCLRRCASSKRSYDNRRSFVRFFRHSSADTTTQHNVPCLCCCCFCRTMFQFLLFTNTVTFSGIFNGMGEYVREANTQYFKKNKRKAQFILDFKERKRKRLTRRKRNHLDHW
ncbi:uncharacterized protein LOC125777195 isoform X1 [Bactrocera dorsalis]|uniref:Uncharacterized protein LOC125777195 isoform X1 n=1 Tax=Bactrocera dorsalis TaxID=27457 RepID=A0ABM3JDX5_BACDO|nr:uncharacterized protein LOC125777195 isoform X1 [Bactrocera dorsalis]